MARATVKGTAQALNWLKSIAASRNSLDSINADLCIRVIEGQKEEISRLGSICHNLMKDRKELEECLDEMTGKAVMKEEQLDIFDFLENTRDKHAL